VAASAPRTPRELLASLPEQRRHDMAAVRSIILDNLPEGYEEAVQSGMLSYQVPLSVYPDTYNGQAAAIACLASHKGAMSLYLMGVYASPERRRKLEQGFKKAGKKLDMGKSCVRFKRAEDLPLHVIGDTIGSISVDQYVAMLRKADSMRKTKPRPKTPPAAKKKSARVAAASRKLRGASASKTRRSRGR
jgi:hypothetical protein